MKKIPGSERIRLNLAITPAVRDRIDRLQELSEAETITEVIRRAVSLYEELLQARLAGSKIMIEHKNGDRDYVRIT